MANANDTSPANTPGPWTYQFCDDENAAFRIQCESDHSDIANVFSRNTHGEQEPNARLIASAPELLDMARSARNAFEERISCLKDELLEDFADTEDIQDQLGHYRCLLKKCEAVIAKAEGAGA